MEGLINMWKIKVEPKFNRVQWNEKIIKNRDELESYLKYLDVKDYTGPGSYEIMNSDGTDSYCTIEYEYIGD